MPSDSDIFLFFCPTLTPVQDEAKSLRKRNIKLFNEILDSMPHLTYKTTWSEAQQMLLENPRFTDDNDVISKYAIGTKCLLDRIVKIPQKSVDFAGSGLLGFPDFKNISKKKKSLKCPSLPNYSDLLNKKKIKKS